MPNTCSVNLQLKKYEGSTGNGFDKVIIACMYLFKATPFGNAQDGR